MKIATPKWAILGLNLLVGDVAAGAPSQNDRLHPSSNDEYAEKSASPARRKLIFFQNLNWLSLLMSATKIYPKIEQDQAQDDNNTSDLPGAQDTSPEEKFTMAVENRAELCAQLPDADKDACYRDVLEYALLEEHYERREALRTADATALDLRMEIGKERVRAGNAELREQKERSARIDAEEALAATREASCEGDIHSQGTKDFGTYDKIFLTCRYGNTGFTWGGFNTRHLDFDNDEGGFHLADARAFMRQQLTPEGRAHRLMTIEVGRFSEPSVAISIPGVFNVAGQRVLSTQQSRYTPGDYWGSQVTFSRYVRGLVPGAYEDRDFRQQSVSFGAGYNPGAQEANLNGAVGWAFRDDLFQAGWEVRAGGTLGFAEQGKTASAYVEGIGSVTYSLARLTVHGSGQGLNGAGTNKAFTGDLQFGGRVDVGWLNNDMDIGDIYIGPTFNASLRKKFFNVGLGGGFEFHIKEEDIFGVPVNFKAGVVGGVATFPYYAHSGEVHGLAYINIEGGKFERRP